MKSRLQSLIVFSLTAAALSLSAGHHKHVSRYSAPDVEVYTIDPVHSGITFKVRHFFTNVPGQFGQFEGKLWLNRADLSKSRVEASVATNSINTHNEDRDAHLNSADFFDSEKYPQMKFVSTEWKKIDRDLYQVTGDLTLLGNTHPVTLQAKLLGFGPGRDEIPMTGWDITGEIDRTQWGMGWGQPMIGDEVRFEINIQAHQVD